MKKYKITIYPITTWSVVVDAKSEKEAKEKAFKLEGPSELMIHNENEWKHEILEWPNIGINGQVDIEKF